MTVHDSSKKSHVEELSQQLFNLIMWWSSQVGVIFLLYKEETEMQKFDLTEFI